jgi:hypothetical protein
VGDKMEMNDMGGACSSDGGEKRRLQGFGGENGAKDTTGEIQV